MWWKRIAKIVAAVGVCLLAGAAGGLFTSPAIPGWYAALQKPAFNPPNWIFGPVWTALYIMMGVAAFLVWDRGWRRPGVRHALAVFAAQLVLNVLWSALFFGARSPAAALVDIFALWLGILASIILFARVSKAGAVLMVPYLLWVSFAAVLNVAIVALNP
jgi:tryptophan-rich sensory protein